MLAAVARVRVATALPDITFLWQYYAGHIMPAVAGDAPGERSARFCGSKDRPFLTEDALCSAEVTWTNWWPSTRGRPFRFIFRHTLPAVRSGRIRSGSKTCCLLQRNG